MLISYHWLKKFIPSLKATPNEVKEKLSVTLAEMESVEKKGEDFILEIENKALTHRPDCFSQYGLAREVAAAFDLKLEKPLPGSEELNLPKEKVSLTEELKVEVTDKTLCPRYTAAVLTGLNIGPSPNWLKTAVERLGIRSINNVVDITNFVMLEVGQPLHAFDADKLIGLSKANSREPFPGISVRTAKKEESLITLDGQKRNLEYGMLLICESNYLQLPTSNFQPSSPSALQLSKPIALAGIMGGLDTEVTEKTTQIILESANFEPFNNRATSRTLGLRTEASLRFEKGLDPNLTVIGLKRAIRLLVEICGAKLGSQIVDIYPQKVEAKTIIIDSQKVSEFLGVKLSIEEMQRILERLQIQSIFNLQPSNSTLNPQPSTLQLTIPTFRRDLNIPQDIYEEIARIYGLNKIIPTLPTRILSAPKRNREYDFEQKVKETLKELDFTEVYTYSFVSEDLCHNLTRKRSLFGSLLRLKNSISPELEYLRASLVPSLLEKVKENAKRFDEVKIFEVGKVTIPKGEELPEEPRKVAGIWQRKKQKEKSEETMTFYYELKGDLEKFFEEMGVPEISFETGFIYLVDSQTLAFELDFAALFANSTEFKKFQSISLHPSVKIDLSMVVDKSILTSQIVEIIKASSGELLTAVEPFDLFEDEKTLGPNKKSVAVHLIFQSQKKSLTQKEVQPLMEKISKNLKENLNAVIR